MKSVATLSADAGRREFPFSDSQFDCLRQFVTAHTGIVLTDAKKDMVYSRLCKHIRHHFNGSFDRFCAAIAQHDQQQCDYLINAITTNLTAFFREPHHFDYLRQTVIPELIEKNQASRRMRIWSAGCSTGEEAYSIAMCLQDAISDISRWDIKILATDLDANVLQKAREAVYTEDRVSALRGSEWQHWFWHGTGKNAGLVKVRCELRDMIQFRRLNLLDDWPMTGPFDVIFCRNVVIYFDKKTQATLFDRYADILTAQGHLFIGHSESLHQVCPRFTALGHTIYRRIS